MTTKSLPIFMGATLLLAAPTSQFACAQTATTATPSALVGVTGKTLAINGTTEIPRGLFGVHAAKMSPADAEQWGVEAVRIIRHDPAGAPPLTPGVDERIPATTSLLVECFYDRFQPAPLLYDPNWESKMAALGTSYGEQAKNSGREHWVEFWNEPYLNWAARPGTNYDGVFFDRTDTTPGTPMTLKGAKEPEKFLVWDEPKLVAVNPESGAVDYLASRYLPDKIEGRAARAGDKWMFRDKILRRLEMRAWGRDTTQTSHYSASQNSLYYNAMFGPFARALKTANPDVKIIAGWGCHLQYDGWRGWDLLYKPLLDEHHELIDALDEHHYGGDTRMVAGSYETVAAYAATKWNKTLKFCNTEAGGMLDPEQPGTNGKPTFVAHNRAELEATMTYTLRDILHLLAASPDKAQTRFAHLAHANGDRFALELLKPLRGQLLETVPTSSDVWSVAAHNGNELVLTLWNDGDTARKLPLQMAAPAGFALGAATRREVVADGESLRVTENPMDARGAVEIGPRRAVVLRVELNPLAETRPNLPQSANWTQFYGPQILQKVEPDGVATVSVTVPAAALKNASRVRVRWVVQGPTAGVRAKWNGVALPVGESSSYIHDEIVDAATLRENNELAISCAPDAPGFLLTAASVFVEGVAEPALQLAVDKQPDPNTPPLLTKLTNMADEGLGHTFARLKKGEPLTVGYFGGSITEGAGASSPKTKWRSLTTAFLQERFPASKITEVSAAVGGTGSDLGAFRCQDDLLKHQPDLVFVEFAVNDLGKSQELILRSMEGIVRQIKRANPQTNIVFVYTASKAMESFYKRDKLPPSVLAHQKVAAHYGIPEINVGQTLFEKVTKDHASDWKSLTAGDGGVHPNDDGYAIYAGQIKGFLLRHENDVESGPRALPIPLTEAPFEAGRLFDAWDLPASNGWIRESKSLAGRYPHRLAANNPEAGVLTYRFNGNAIGIYWLIAPDSGDIEWSIDGGEWKRNSSWDKYAKSYSRANYRILDANLLAGQHELKIRVAQEKNPQSTGNKIRIGALLVNEVAVIKNKMTP